MANTLHLPSFVSHLVTDTKINIRNSTKFPLTFTAIYCNSLKLMIIRLQLLLPPTERHES
jgi:hypothetical protein